MRKNSAFEYGGNSPSADDDRKLPRTGTETAEQEFTLRLRERHGDGWNTAETCHLVKLELEKGGIPLSEFLPVDAEKTKSPRKLTNPDGYYVKRAREIVQRRQGGHKERVLAQGIAIRQAVAAKATAKPPERCSRCRGGGMLSPMEYCDCSMGRELAKIEARKADPRPVQVVA